MIFKLSLFIAAITLSARAELFSGEATTYGGNALGGACGFQQAWSSWSPMSMGLTAALNMPQWDQSLNCGRCALVNQGNNPSVIVQIVDQCPDCKQGDLDLALPAWTTITGASPSRVSITWSFVDCPDIFVMGDIEIVLKQGSNTFWTAFQPQNFKQGISSLEVDVGNGWTQLARDEQIITGYYFVSTTGISNRFRLRATSVEGQVIETPFYETLDSVLYTKQQFSSQDQPQETPISSNKSSSTPTMIPVSSNKSSSTPTMIPISSNKSSSTPTMIPVASNKSSSMPTMIPVASNKSSSMPTMIPKAPREEHSSTTHAFLISLVVKSITVDSLAKILNDSFINID